jgi:PAS domain S-box-containing protein
MGTWDWDLIDDSMHWDVRMHALFGMAPSTFSGRYEQFLEMIHAENRQKTATEFAQAVEKCAEYDGEFRVVWPTDGSVHTLRARSKVYCDKQGKPMRVTGVSWDVSERSRMEKALERERFLTSRRRSELKEDSPRSQENCAKRTKPLSKIWKWPGNFSRQCCRTTILASHIMPPRKRVQYASTTFTNPR